MRKIVSIKCYYVNELLRSFRTNIFWAVITLVAFSLFFACRYDSCPVLVVSPDGFVWRTIIPLASFVVYLNEETETK